HYRGRWKKAAFESFQLIESVDGLHNTRLVTCGYEVRVYVTTLTGDHLERWCAVERRKDVCNPA
ncbi:hypothetical protein DIPPA_12386, partial [Diplonema papillatum]